MRKMEMVETATMCVARYDSYISTGHCIVVVVWKNGYIIYGTIQLLCFNGAINEHPYFTAVCYSSAVHWQLESSVTGWLLLHIK